MKKSAKIFSVCTAVVVLTALAVIVYAVVNSKANKTVKNDFYPAEISIAVQENGELNENPQTAKELEWVADGENYKAKKQVQILNANKDGENNADAYIRVCFVPHWTVTLPDGTEADVASTKGLTSFGNYPESIEGSTFTMGDVTFTLNSDWESSWIYNSTDGYFYCKNIVGIGDSTAQLLDGISMTKDAYEKIPDGVSLRVDVLADAIQTEGGAVDARWSESGIKIGADKELAKE